MLITKEVKVYNDIVTIENLSINSHKLVEVKCDNCGNIKKIKYQLFNKLTKNNTKDYYCNNKECINKSRQIAIQEKYGFNNVFQLNDIKDKIKETNLEKYGVKNPQQNKEIKEKTEKTNLEKYGVKNPFQSEIFKDKLVKTNIKKYGVKYPSQSEEIKEKMYSTSIKNYGFKYPTQNREHLYKRFNVGYRIEYIDGLSCQGGYEKDFILKFKDKVRIENGLSIEYYYNGEKKVYHSDYYLPDFNLVVEIKSTYWYELNKELCLAKEEYTRKKYNYLMILDKKYEEFNFFI